MLEIAAERLPRRPLRPGATRSRCRSRTTRSSACSPATSTATSRSRTASRFLAEARRVAPELVVVDSALRDDVEPVEWQERVLNDGSRWQVYKRYFDPDELAAELGGGEMLFAGRWFVAVRA